MTREDSFADRCDLVADAFQSLAHMDPRLGMPTVPASGRWSEQVPAIVVRSLIGGDVLVRLDEHQTGWLIGGGRRRTRVVAGEDLVESVATLLRGDYLDAPAAYADGTGERRS